MHTESSPNLDAQTKRPSNVRAKPIEAVFSWSHVHVRTQEKRSFSDCIRCRPPKPERVLLSDVSGIAVPGQIVAIMGASGVGKTTLLKALSGQEDSDATTTTTGDFYLNGHPAPQSQRLNNSVIGYIEQHELFVETMSAEEHLIFQAMLRMKNSVKDEDRRIAVKEIMTRLSLDRSAGTAVSDLSGGERKRLAFATVFLTHPPVILIDEPTSGLDAHLAKTLMKTVRTTAIDFRLTIIAVLHHVTSEIYTTIDSLCLMAHGGRQAFFGDKDSAVTFFSTECGLSALSLDEYIEQVAQTPDNEQKAVHNGSMVADCFEKSSQLEALQQAVSVLCQQPLKKINDEDIEVGKAGFYRQLKWLLWRAAVSTRRDPVRTINILVRAIIPSVFFGLIYFNLHKSTEYAQNLEAVALAILHLTLNTSIYVLLCTMSNEIHLYIKETNRGIYGTLPYYITVVVRDLPIFIGMVFIFTTIVYWMARISTSFTHYLVYVAIVILACNTSAALGALISSFSETIDSAVAIAIPANLLVRLFSGFFIDLRYVAPVFRVFEYLSFYHYGFSALTGLEFYWNSNKNTKHCMHGNIGERVPQNLTSNTIYSNGTLFNASEPMCRKQVESHVGFDVAMLVVLFCAYHLLSLCIVWFRGHRSQVTEFWSRRKKAYLNRV